MQQIETGYGMKLEWHRDSSFKAIETRKKRRKKNGRENNLTKSIYKTNKREKKTDDIFFGIFEI